MREAIINLTDEEIEAMGYGDLISLVREAGIHDIELLEDDGRGGVSQIQVEQRLDEERLAGVDSVEDWQLVGEAGDSYVYVLDVVARDLPERASCDHNDLLGACEPTVNDRGMLLSLVGSQESIRTMVRNFEAAGITPDLHRLGDYEGGSDTPLDALMDRQREILRTAYDMGFYEVPREASVADIADALDIESGTVAEHLQRAERNLLSQQFVAAD